MKVHGYRIDPSEVEAALLQQTGVRQAVVAARARPGEEQQLVAYITCEARIQPRTATLQRALRSTLPGYMVPKTFVLLDDFPLTPHGKIDREKLAALPEARADHELEIRPMRETELLLARIWSETLDRDHVERDADFFELGGDSLTAATVASHIQRALGVEIDLGALTRKPALTDFAGLVDDLMKSAGGAACPGCCGLRASGRYPCRSNRNAPGITRRRLKGLRATRSRAAIALSVH